MSNESVTNRHQVKTRGKNMKEKSLAVFEDYHIRRVFEEESETWYFSVVDIIAALIQQPDYQAARKYWKVLKGRLAKEGSQLVTNGYQLKMSADDGALFGGCHGYGQDTGGV
jgi:hypothetical protein